MRDEKKNSSSCVPKIQTKTLVNFIIFPKFFQNLPSSKPSNWEGFLPAMSSHVFPVTPLGRPELMVSEWRCMASVTCPTFWTGRRPWVCRSKNRGVITVNGTQNWGGDETWCKSMGIWRDLQHKEWRNKQKNKDVSPMKIGCFSSLSR